MQKVDGVSEQMKAKVIVDMQDGTTMEFEGYVSEMEISSNMDTFVNGELAPLPPIQQEVSFCILTTEPMDITPDIKEKVKRAIGPRKVIIDESPK